MHAASFPARQSRVLYRHELRTLAYVTLDEANGGIVRNLNFHGVGVQAVAALRQKQRVRVRFELRYPRLRVDSQGEVAWSDPSGQCGICFVGLSTRTGHQIKEWMFGNLLDSIFRDAAHDRPILQAPSGSTGPEENDGLIFSPAPVSTIQLAPSKTSPDVQFVPLQSEAPYEGDFARDAGAQLDWLSRPLSGRTMAWLIDSLIMTAAVLLFALIFLSIAHELPKWPLNLAGATGAAIFVVAAYRTIFLTAGGATLGARLAGMAGSSSVDDEERIDDEVRLR